MLLLMCGQRIDMLVMYTSLMRHDRVRADYMNTDFSMRRLSGLETQGACITFGRL